MFLAQTKYMRTQVYLGKNLADIMRSVRGIQNMEKFKNDFVVIPVDEEFWDRSLSRKNWRKIVKGASIFSWQVVQASCIVTENTRNTTCWVNRWTGCLCTSNEQLWFCSLLNELFCRVKPNREVYLKNQRFVFPELLRSWFRATAGVASIFLCILGYRKFTGNTRSWKTCYTLRKA